MKRLSWIALCLSLVMVLGGCSPKVPDLTGMTVERATKTLSDAGLKRGTLTYDSSSHEPSGTVVSQEPQAGASLPSGSSVLLKLAGTAPVIAPTLAGLNATEVAAALAADGLQIQVVESYSETAAAGTVLGQSPAAGANTASGSTVKVIISKGPKPIALPNVIGKTAQDASATLMAAGFKVKATSAANEATVGTVFAQSPTSEAQRGATISISVSLGGKSTFSLTGTWKSKAGSTYQFRAGSRVAVPGGGVVRYRFTGDGVQLFHPGNTVFAQIVWINADRITIALWSGKSLGPAVTYNRVK